MNKTFSNFRRLKEIWGITRAPNIKTKRLLILIHALNVTYVITTSETHRISAFVAVFLFCIATKSDVSFGVIFVFLFKKGKSFWCLQYFNFLSMLLILGWLLKAQIPILDKPTSFLHDLRLAFCLLLESVVLQKKSAFHYAKKDVTFMSHLTLKM